MWRHGIILISLGSLLSGPVEHVLAVGRGSARDAGPITQAQTNIPSTIMGEAQWRHRELARVAEVVSFLGGKPHMAPMFLAAAREYEIDPAFIASVAFIESSFRPTAESNKGARGLMQIRPLVMKIMGVTDPWDPYQNVMAGAGYLRYCFERYRSHPNATYLALAAYNIGPGRVEKLTGSDSAKRFVSKVMGVYNTVNEEPVSSYSTNGENSPTSEFASPVAAETRR